MALVGSLRDLSLPELLAIIDNGEKSGVITIRSDAATAQIHVEGGRIVMASDTLRDERFGEVMLKLGKISQEILAKALAAQKTSARARRLGSILVEMGAITNKDQDEALLYQTCEAVYDLCTWQVGYFQFDLEETPDSSGISIQVDTLLEEVDRRAVAGARARAESIRPEQPILRGRREITPDKMELLRLTRSFKLHTDEFKPLEDEDALAPVDQALREVEPTVDQILDVSELEPGKQGGESL
ncbi:MAG TPA: DUF4388 domain-containing protein [Candidatus Dormibacteraeota bacterium]|nr:DUF4388 domain-containing protein [Candidatus Dormibacteraeota bacterium]